MSSGYFNQFGVDLDAWFGPRLGATPAPPTGYKVAGVDLNLRYYPLSAGGFQVPPTGFLYKGKDLNTIFGIPAPGSASIEAFPIQTQALDGITVTSFPANLPPVTTKVYAPDTFSGPVAYGSNIPFNSILRPKIPITSGIGTIDNDTVPNGSVILSLRVKEPNGSYSSLLQDFPSAFITSSGTGSSTATLVGDVIPGLYTLIQASINQVTANSITVQVWNPPPMPGPPDTLLYQFTIDETGPSAVTVQDTVTSITAAVDNLTQAGAILTYSTSTFSADGSIPNAVTTTFNADISSVATHFSTQQIFTWDINVGWTFNPPTGYSIVGSYAFIPPVSPPEFAMSADASGGFGPTGTDPWAFTGFTTDNSASNPNQPDTVFTNSYVMTQPTFGGIDVLGDYYFIDVTGMMPLSLSANGNVTYSGP